MAQIVTKYDSMDLAKEMLYSHRLQEAIGILEILDNKYREDENIKYLYSQALYWNKEYNNVLVYIRTTVDPSPGLNIHFGKILFELNRLKEAQSYISTYLISHKDDPEALLLMAKITYWQGGSNKEALRFIDRVLINDPLHPQARLLKEEINMNTAPQLSINAAYFQDSQPLEAMLYSARLSFYHHTWLQPALQVNTNHYAGGEKVVMANFSNRAVIPNTKTELALTSGIFANSWSNGLTPTWSAALKQNLLNNIFLRAEASQLPYLYTLASIGQNEVPLSLSTSLTKEAETGWTGNITLQQWHFMDENKIGSISSWFLFPVVQHPILSLNIGYAFMRAHADHNRFALDDSYVSPIGFGEVYPGVFNPYFTPQNQMAHAALAKFDINFTKKIKASINSNIGVYATIDNPNYINYGSPIVRPPGKGPDSGQIPQPPKAEEDGIQLVLIPTRYFPIDLKGRLSMDLSRSFVFHTEWSYMSTIYFNSQTVNLGFNWKFSKG